MFERSESKALVCGCTVYTVIFLAGSILCSLKNVSNLTFYEILDIQEVLDNQIYKISDTINVDTVNIS